jgi:hypothetical protein
MRLRINKLSGMVFLLPAYLIFSSLILLLPAFYNGYPLFYSDSAVYILAANLFGNLSGSEDLPFLSGIGYALFIRMVSWRETLYLVVFAQAILLNILIYYTLKALLHEAEIYKFHLPIIIILSLCSSMGWTVSQLMPDIFTSYLVLSVFLIYSWNTKSLGMYIFLSIVICFSILSHLTNITISVLLVGLIFVFFFFLRPNKKDLMVLLRKSVLIVALMVTSLLILIGLNKKLYNYMGLSPTSSIFFMARMMDTGFMEEFLNEKCEKRNYDMCAHRHNLPGSYEGFLWDPESIFNKTGGWDVQKHNEYGLIVRDMLTTPKYLGKFLCNCSEHSLRQLTTFQIGDGLTKIYKEGSAQYQTVISHFDKREFREDFVHSKQTQGKLNFNRINVINYIILSVSLMIILWTWLRSKFDQNLILFTFIILATVLVNAFVTSSLSSVFSRFQSRIIWLIPLLAGVYFSAFLYSVIKSRIGSFGNGS